jgi:hypothetical protein
MKNGKAMYHHALVTVTTDVPALVACRAVPKGGDVPFEILSRFLSAVSVMPGTPGYIKVSRLDATATYDVYCIAADEPMGVRNGHINPMTQEAIVATKQTVTMNRITCDDPSADFETRGVQKVGTDGCSASAPIGTPCFVECKPGFLQATFTGRAAASPCKDNDVDSECAFPEDHNRHCMTAIGSIGEETLKQGRYDVTFRCLEPRLDTVGVQTVGVMNPRTYEEPVYGMVPAAGFQLTLQPDAKQTFSVVVVLLGLTDGDGAAPGITCTLKYRPVGYQVGPITLAWLSIIICVCYQPLTLYPFVPLPYQAPPGESPWRYHDDMAFAADMQNFIDIHEIALSPREHAIPLGEYEYTACCEGATQPRNQRCVSADNGMFKVVSPDGVKYLPPKVYLSGANMGEQTSNSITVTVFTDEAATMRCIAVLGDKQVPVPGDFDVPGIDTFETTAQEATTHTFADLHGNANYYVYCVATDHSATPVASSQAQIRKNRAMLRSGPAKCKRPTKLPPNVVIDSGCDAGGVRNSGCVVGCRINHVPLVESMSSRGECDDDEGEYEFELECTLGDETSRSVAAKSVAPSALLAAVVVVVVVAALL